MDMLPALTIVIRDVICAVFAVVICAVFVVRTADLTRIVVEDDLLVLDGFDLMTLLEAVAAATVASTTAV